LHNYLQLRRSGLRIQTRAPWTLGGVYIAKRSSKKDRASKSIHFISCKENLVIGIKPPRIHFITRAFK
jgi:hypothetical protein